jgi:hypothetical protein
VFSSLLLAGVELIDATSGIDQLGLSGIKRMAVRADFHAHIAGCCGAGFEGVPASAGYRDGVVGWVDSRFHNSDTVAEDCRKRKGLGVLFFFLIFGSESGKKDTYQFYSSTHCGYGPRSCSALSAESSESDDPQIGI